MIISDTATISYEPLSALLIQTIVTAFTILTAFSIRDSVTQGIAAVSPNNSDKKLVFTVTVTLFFLFITVLMAYMWQDKIKG